MKYLLSFLVVLLVSFSVFSDTFSATNSIFNNTTNEIPYDNQDLGLEAGVKAIKDVALLEDKNVGVSTYIQRVVKFLLGFLALIATLMIIYAGFKLLIGAGDEEASKSSKSIILYAVIGLGIIFLAGPIVDFVLNALNTN